MAGETVVSGTKESGSAAALEFRIREFGPGRRTDGVQIVHGLDDFAIKISEMNICNRKYRMGVVLVGGTDVCAGIPSVQDF